MSLQSLQLSSTTRPMLALHQRATRHPTTTAVRARRRGLWLSHTWSQLANEAHLLARAWTDFGISRGDEVVVLGPLGFDLVVALFAADTLGVTLELAAPESAAEARLLQNARWALVDGGHELERLLRHRGTSLQHIFLSDADLVLDAQAIQGLSVHRLDRVLAGPTGAWSIPGEATTAPVFRVHGDIHFTDSAQRLDVPSPDHGEKILADFDPTWPAGLDFILHVWPGTGAELLLPEPLGDASTDRRQARAHVWLAPHERLEQFTQELSERLPSAGPSAAVVRAALRGQSTPWAVLVRRRIKAVLGLDRLHTVSSDADMPPALAEALTALGIRFNRSGVPEPRLTSTVRTAHLPVQDGLDGAFARSAT